MSFGSKCASQIAVLMLVHYTSSNVAKIVQFSHLIYLLKQIASLLKLSLGANVHLSRDHITLVHDLHQKYNSGFSANVWKCTLNTHTLRCVCAHTYMNTHPALVPPDLNLQVMRVMPDADIMTQTSEKSHSMVKALYSTKYMYNFVESYSSPQFWNARPVTTWFKQTSVVVAVNLNPNLSYQLPY